MFLPGIFMFLVAYASFLLSAICGGGAGLILIPILGSILPIQFIPATLSIGTFTSSVTRFIVFYKAIRWDIVRWFVPPAIGAVWLGAWLLKYVNPLYMEVFIGLFLMSNVPFLFKKPETFKSSQRPSNVSLAFIGLMAGFVSGVTGAVGLLFNKFYLRCGMVKEEIVATRAANEILLHAIKLILYAAFGLINSKVIFFGALIAIAAVASTWSTKTVLSWLNDATFKKIGYLAMSVSGAVLLTQSTMGIVATEKGGISFNPLQKGLEAKLKWQKANFAFEFTIDDGLEFEQVIPQSDLTSEQQKLITKHSLNLQSDATIVEAVYGFHKRSYEAYFFKKNQFLEKIEF